MDRVATLGRSGDTISPSSVHADIARDSLGQFYTWSGNRRAVLVYGSDGSLQRTIGRTGDGPGEIPRTGTRLVLARGDSLLLFMRNRYTVYTTSGLLVRDVGLPGGVFGPPVPLPDGRMIVAASWNRPETVGLGVHVLAADGSRSLSFMGDGNFNVRCLQCLTHRIGAAGKDSSNVWVIPPNEYEIQKRSLDGRLLESLHVSDSWLNPSADSLTPNVPILAVREDGDGLLWIFGVLRPTIARRAGGIGTPPESLRSAAAAQVQTVIDVIDPVSGVLVATATVAGLFHPFAPEYVSRIVESERGEVFVEVYRTFIQVH